jgi:hypothetical protein
VVATPVDVEPAVAPCEVKMSLSVQLMCDRDVPYGTCGVRLMVLTDSVDDAIRQASDDGWSVTPKTASKPARVLCPGHARR